MWALSKSLASLGLLALGLQGALAAAACVDLSVQRKSAAEKSADLRQSRVKI